MSLLVDTTVWYGAAAEGDVSNGRAREILASGEALMTTDPCPIAGTAVARMRGAGAAVRGGVRVAGWSVDEP